MIDKEKTCKDCPDRTVIPNCHSTCEGYLKRRAKQDEIIEAKRKYYAADDFYCGVKEKIRKRTQQKRK